MHKRPPSRHCLYYLTVGVEWRFHWAWVWSPVGIIRARLCRQEQRFNWSPHSWLYIKGGPVRHLGGQRSLFSQEAGCSGTELGVAVVSARHNPSSSSLCLFALFLQVSLVGFLFLLGLYISSLASCMGGLYGAPRILQCIAQERVIPALAFLGRGVGV